MRWLCKFSMENKFEFACYNQYLIDMSKKEKRESNVDTSKTPLPTFYQDDI